MIESLLLTAARRLTFEQQRVLTNARERRREYVTILDADAVTPAPRINVIANPGFDFQAAAEGSGYTWAENSRENQLTSWSNDAVGDPTGEAIYVRDEETFDHDC